MPTVFDVFTTEPYVFLKVNQGVKGNTVADEYPASGIVKLRDGMVQTDSMETRDSTSTLHVKPNEQFVDELQGNLVGHGVRVMSSDGSPVEYRITGQTVGKNWDNGRIEHITCTVKKESFVWQDESELSLE